MPPLLTEFSSVIMKTKNPILLIGLLVFGFTAAALNAAESKKVAGPHGGRILAGLEPRVEFFVTAERKVQITFLDRNGKAVAPAEQVVTVTTGDRAAPTRLTFAPSGGALVSNQPLPTGNDWPTVVQIKSTPAAKTVTERFNLNLSTCSECKLGEYACICDH